MEDRLKFTLKWIIVSFLGISFITMMANLKEYSSLNVEVGIIEFGISMIFLEVIILCDLLQEKTAKYEIQTT